MTKPTKWHVRPAKIQISLGIRHVWSESSLFAWRMAGSLATHWVHSEDSEETGWVHRLIRVFAGRTVISLVLLWGGSNAIASEIRRPCSSSGRYLMQIHVSTTNNQNNLKEWMPKPKRVSSTNNAVMPSFRTQIAHSCHSLPYSLASCNVQAILAWRPFLGPRQTVQTQNAASDQGLHCLLTWISINNNIKMKKCTSHPINKNGWVH